MNTDPVYQADYVVRSYEVDTDGLIRPLTMFNYLQDAAGEHAAELKVSVPTLLKRNLTWVISRYHVHFLSFPPAHGLIRLRTWPSAREGRFALREFELSDGEDRPVMAATSSWMLIDLSTRRPVRIEQHIPKLPAVERRSIADEFPSLPVPETCNCELPFRVRHSDLDLNRHVNNTVYIDWALETLPAEVIGHVRPSGLEVSYRAEANYGDRIISRTFYPGMNEPSLHQLVREKDGTEVARLRVAWRPAKV